MGKTRSFFASVNQMHFTALMLTICLMLICFSGAAFAEDSVCARVKIEIRQEVTLERQAFDAHMKITNGLSHVSLEDIVITVDFKNEAGNAVLASSDPNNTDALFFIRLDTRDNIDNIDGTGSIAPLSVADIHWLIIPAPGASNGLENGTLYYVGAKLTYTIGGEENITEVTPDYIYVKPMPELTLDYFLPEDVYGDDAFTAEIEPTVPFSLGVRVKNNGAGAAKNLKIESAQPKIIDNDQGLLIGFVIEGCEVDDQPVTNSLLADFGDIASDSSKIARWIMTCSLSGKFVNFEADFSHSDELGGKLTSLLDATNTHFLVQDVLVDLPGRDTVRDFLGKDGDTYRLYESNGNDTEIIDQSPLSSLQLDAQNVSESRYTLTTPVTSGFAYVKLTDPESGRKRIKTAFRRDSKTINTNNIWLSKTRDGNNNWQYFINLFDVNTLDTYTIIYEDLSAGPMPPVIQFINNKERVEGQQLSFLVSASDPNGTVPILSAASLPAGASFVDQKDGNGVFDWTPATGQSGKYNVTFTASDGALSDYRTIEITVYSADDSDGDGMPDNWELSHFNTLDNNGTGDFDGDGILDLDEYLYGTNPKIEDHVPSVPEILFPVTGAHVDTLLPELSISNSIDPDGDTVSYEFEMFADAAMTISLFRDENVIETSGTTSWVVPDNLGDNSRYYWRVRATDGVSYSLWAYGSFFVNTQNDPPSGIAVSSPVENAVVGTLTPLLQVMNANDVDEETITYDFELYSDAALTTLISSSGDITESTNGATGWIVPAIAQLSNGMTYYWKATASDPQGAWVEIISSFEIDTTNSAPGIPVISSPAIDTDTAREIDLIIENVTDADGDAVVYYFEIDRVASFKSPSLIRSGIVQEIAETTSWSVTALNEDTQYFWRVKANDGISDSKWVYGRFFVNTINSPPEAPVLKNPGNNAWVGTLTPELILAASKDSDNDALTYRFEIFSDKQMTQSVAQGNSASPSWITPQSLSDNTWYYWRAQAEDENGMRGEWMTTTSFFVRNNEILPPTDFELRVLTDKGRALEGIKIYAFTEFESYTGLNSTTDADGNVLFDPDNFTDGNYKFRVDYLGRQFWSQTVQLPGAKHLDVVIPEETIEVSIVTASGPVAGIKVYLFSESGAYLGIYATTDANGNVYFDLPSGINFTFRADVLGGQYWSGAVPITGGSTNTYTLDAGGGLFRITLREDAQTTMEGINVYLFSQNGSYLNLNRTSDAIGQVGYDVPEGIYKVRADHLGYKFWSNEIVVNSDTDVDLLIPHHDVDITVNDTYMGSNTSVEGVKTYLFTASDTYQNRTVTTDANGKVMYHVPEMDYKVRADYMGQQFWSNIFNAQDAEVNIPMADAVVTVGWNTFTLENVTVYAFTASGTYLNLNGTTDVNGRIVFRLPAGDYKFRADYQSSQYWSNETTLVADQENLIDVSTGGGSFDFTVLKGSSNPLVGVNCYVFSESGTYFGMHGPSSSDGIISFDLADGTYKIRVDYLGYQFWSDLCAVPDTLTNTLNIAHRENTVTVNGEFQNNLTPIEGIKSYLFKPSGAYQNQNLTTDVNGEVVFDLPDQLFKIRADYMGQEFWSDEFQFQDTAINIPMAGADIIVTGGGATLEGVTVYVYTAAGSYLNLNQPTGVDGNITFHLPAGDYKFRADYQGSQYWTDVQTLAADQNNAIEINTGGGIFNFTVLKDVNDPLIGTTCYLFSETGAYLNLNSTTSSEGLVSFSLADGRYKFRVDYLGYKFWSDVYQVADVLSGILTIPHKDSLITVTGDFNGATPIEGIKVYLFTSSGAYQNQNLLTNVSGQVIFSLPDQLYKVRADYMGYQFWSDAFHFEDKTVTVPEGMVEIHATRSGVDLEGAKVYLFTGSGVYQNINELTDANGIVSFIVPAREYSFRIDEGGEQKWSGVVDVQAGSVHSVDVRMD